MREKPARHRPEVKVRGWVWVGVLGSRCPPASWPAGLQGPAHGPPLRPAAPSGAAGVPAAAGGPQLGLGPEASPQRAAPRPGCARRRCCAGPRGATPPAGAADGPHEPSALFPSAPLHRACRRGACGGGVGEVAGAQHAAGRRAAQPCRVRSPTGRRRCREPPHRPAAEPCSTFWSSCGGARHGRSSRAEHRPTSLAALATACRTRS